MGNKKVLVIVMTITVLIGIGIFVFLRFRQSEEFYETNYELPKFTSEELTFQDPACSREFIPKSNVPPYYQGPLFDTHFHLPPAFRYVDPGGVTFPVLWRNIFIKDIVCSFEKEKVIGAFAFYFPNFKVREIDSSIPLNTWMKDALYAKKQSPSWLHLFLTTDGLLSAPEVQSVLSSNAGVFDGLGELIFFGPGSLKPDAEVELAIYQVAAENRLVVMLHPDRNQKSNVENLLKKYPDVKFLTHGWQNPDYIFELMGKYPNLYFSLDAATLYLFNGLIDGPKEKFLAKFSKDFNSVLNKNLKKWKPRIEKYPNQYLWGTDRYADWHYSEEASLIFEEFVRAFIGKLEPSVQEKFAYQNAETLMKQ